MVAVLIGSTYVVKGKRRKIFMQMHATGGDPCNSSGCSCSSCFLTELMLAGLTTWICIRSDDSRILMVPFFICGAVSYC